MKKMKQIFNYLGFYVYLCCHTFVIIAIDVEEYRKYSILRQWLIGDPLKTRKWRMNAFPNGRRYQFFPLMRFPRLPHGPEQAMMICFSSKFIGLVEFEC